MADADVAGELGDLLLLEDVADLAVVLVQAQPPVVLCDDAGRILAAVLQGEERPRRWWRPRACPRSR